MVKKDTEKSTNDSDTFQFWIKQIDAAEQERSEFEVTGQRIVDIYRVRRKFTSTADRRAWHDVSRVNILYSNTETVLPVLYSRTPQPEAIATDSNDLEAKSAAEIFESALAVALEADNIDDLMESGALLDYLLPGVGILRVSYEPITEEAEVRLPVVEKDGEFFTVDPDGNEEEVDENDVQSEGPTLSPSGMFVERDGERIISEEAPITHVHWKDFLHGFAKKWEDVPWEAFRGDMTRPELVEMFGAKGSEVKMDNASRSKNIARKDRKVSDDFETATVWEIWDKTKRQRVFISPGFDKGPLDVEEDPLGLRDFFPNGKPLYSNVTTDSLIPIPFYKQYEDLVALELNEISTRSMKLTRELKRRGVYDKSFKDLQRIKDLGDNGFIGVENYSRLVEKGGLNAAFQELDNSGVIEVLSGLDKRKEVIKQEIFEIMGIADIMRAVSDPRETLGAQQLKGRFGSLRISKNQRKVQRFIKDIYALKAEVMAENFSPETIARLASVEPQQVDARGQQVEVSPEQHVREKVMPFIQDQEPQAINVGIETDSTIALDEQQQKENAVEFGTVMAEMTDRIPSMVQAYGIDFTTELIMETARKFGISRSLEDKLLDQAKKAKEQEGQPQEPSIEQQKLELDKQKVQMEAQKDQAEMQLEVAKLKLKDQELQMKAGVEGTKARNAENVVNFKGLETALKFDKLALDEKKLAAEAANPKDNAIVGA